jgi:anti-anti-sigma regulatory factor
MPTIILPAEFDEAASEKLRQELLSKLAVGSATLQLDFAAVAGLSATGLALLLSFMQEATAAQPPPVIKSRRVCPGVRTVLRVAGLDTAFGLAG